MPAGPDRPGRRERPFCAAGRLARRPVRLTAPRDTNDNLMRGITSIGHVAIRVEEFERSLAFYVGKLGFSEMFRLDRDAPGSSTFATDDQHLELFSMPLATGRPRLRTSGLFCLTVDDI